MRNIKFISSTLILLLFCGQILFAQTDRGVGNRQTAEKRLALVIGNGAYQKTSELPNPSNDAADMKTALSALGFEVISGTNQNKRQMEQLIRDFGERLARQGGVGLFFYAGHGLQVKGSNYLVPVDAEIPAEDEVEYATVDLNFLLGKMDAAKNDLNIVILDACRNNPFARSWRNFRDVGQGAGLAKITPPTGTIMLYATQPGNVASDGSGRNGLFTESLLEQIRKPGVELDAMIKQLARDVSERSGKKQMPWKEGIVTGDFYFAGGGGAQPAVNPVSIQTPVDNSRSAEDVMWNTIERINTKLAVEGYLSEYPNGKYAATARLMVKVFEAEEQKKAREMEESINARAVKVGMEKSNGLGMRFMGVPAGSFQMGSTNGEADEIVHMVTISRGFYMGRTEVTQAQWRAVMGNNPSEFKDCDNCPVDTVSWNDVQAFLGKLNARGEGAYRLPTEAEWEYAARAGTTGDYAASPDDVAWYKSNSGSRPNPVGAKQPNAWGLYDMHGNVYEWVQDWYGEYPRSAVTDQGGAASGEDRVIRGGSYLDSARYIRSAFRRFNTPSRQGGGLVGFRVVRIAE
jgi:formylglycine-generating enzyme required for sulfatase activity